MGKLIIDNRSKLSDYEAVCRCLQVISQGKISGNNDRYCLAMAWETATVYSEKNKKSDRFVVVDSDNRKLFVDKQGNENANP